jgi:hypothetical protein
MKTNRSLGTVKLSTLASLGVAIAAVLVLQPISAVAVTNSLVITENSSTSLTVTYNGSTSGVTVLFDGPDLWDVILPPTVEFVFTFVGTWGPETENANNSNAVAFRSPLNVFSVFSDQPGSADFPNGTPVNIGGAIDLSNFGEIRATFVDNGDIARAADTGSPFAMLAVSLTALFGASRLRSLRLA